MTIVRSNPLFETTQVRVSDELGQRITLAEMDAAILRHVLGDWGDIGDAGRAENEQALRDGHPILSVYPLKDGERFWVMTDATRQVTTLMFAREY